MEKIFITIIMPTLNEEKNILAAIEDTLSAFKEFGISGEILVINDGSTDSTPQLIKQKIEEFSDKVRMVSHPTPFGVGASFWDGVDAARGEIICMLPGDNENDPKEILRYIHLLDDVDIVIPFVFNREVRSRLRNFISTIYHRIINLTFFTSLNYTTGTVLYKKSLLKELPVRRKGFFFQTDILIRLVKQGYLYAEVPYRLRGRRKGRSKVTSLHSIKEIVKDYLYLLKDIYFKKKTQIVYASDSISAKRYKTI